jgi:hypothetical protein
MGRNATEHSIKLVTMIAKPDKDTETKNIKLQSNFLEKHRYKSS